MTRRGKIARLPSDVREELNRRLEDGKPGNKLVTWLNSLQTVKDVLKTEFNNQPINPQNLSEWKHGGYRDWLLQQKTIDRVRLMQDNSDALSRAANNRPLSDLLAQQLAAHMVPLAQKLNDSAADGVPDPKLLCELCTDVVALRRSDHSAERLKLQRDRLDFVRESDTRDLEKLRREWDRKHRPEIREPDEMFWRKINEARRRVFGSAPGSEDSGVTESPNDATLPHKSPVDPTEPNQIKPDQTNNVSP